MYAQLSEARRQLKTIDTVLKKATEQSDRIVYLEEKLASVEKLLCDANLDLEKEREEKQMLQLSIDRLLAERLSTKHNSSFLGSQLESPLNYGLPMSNDDVPESLISEDLSAIGKDDSANPVDGSSTPTTPSLHSEKEQSSVSDKEEENNAGGSAAPEVGAFQAERSESPLIRGLRRTWHSITNKTSRFNNSMLTSEELAKNAENVDPKSTKGYKSFVPQASSTTLTESRLGSFSPDMQLSFAKSIVENQGANGVQWKNVDSTMKGIYKDKYTLLGGRRLADRKSTLLAFIECHREDPQWQPYVCLLKEKEAEKAPKALFKPILKFVDKPVIKVDSGPAPKPEQKIPQKRGGSKKDIKPPVKRN